MPICNPLPRSSQSPKWNSSKTGTFRLSSAIALAQDSLKVAIGVAAADGIANLTPLLARPVGAAELAVGDNGSG
jgi:hypothetical protein